MIIASVNWTNVLESLIAAIPAIIAAVASALYAKSIHGQIKTPSGNSIGDVAEFTHDTSIANNLLLSKSNGPTKTATHDTLSSTPGPQIPDDK